MFVATLLVFVVGYYLLDPNKDKTLLEAIYMVVITVSTVGYGESTSLSPQLQLFTIIMIAVGMTLATYTFGGFIQMVTAGELHRAIGQQRMLREIDELNDHVIVCGFGRIGQTLTEELTKRNQNFAVVDSEAKSIEEVERKGFLGLRDDATEEETLLKVGIERAKTLVTSLPSDADNVFITLTARNLNPDLLIISRAELRSTEKKLRQAGADRVIMPTIIGGQSMARLVTRPTTADLLEVLSEIGSEDLELDELPITKTSPILGKTVKMSRLSKDFDLLVVGVKKPTGEIFFNPKTDYVFQENDILVVMGHSYDIQEFVKKTKETP
ncbi:MAG: potassium channel protein [Pirellulaceae bacterium]|nr:potassium channel protein [Pirellulaceae bacterium]